MAWISKFEFNLISMQPEEVVSKTTLFKPFGLSTWVSVGISVLGMMGFLLLTNWVTGQSNYVIGTYFKAVAMSNFYSY